MNALILSVVAGDASGVFAFFGTFMLFIGAFALFYLYCHWRIFTKAGEAGWKSIIPFYNLYVELRIARQPGIWLLFMFIPLVNIYFGIRHVHGLSRAFGKGVGFTLGLLFLPFIFIPILALGSAQYQYHDNGGLLGELHEN